VQVSQDGVAGDGRPIGYRFGIFEIDLRSGQLRRAGRPTPLQEQPLRVLAALLERGGGTVSREELRARLWPDGVAVDYERGLSNALSRLRGSLRDEGQPRRFVGTVPGRGYRLLLPIEPILPAAPRPKAGPPFVLPAWLRRAAQAALIAALLLTAGATAAWTVRPVGNAPPVKIAPEALARQWQGALGPGVLARDP
jgi:DNA-binding winged helix-turn-helix (wHTH) protein